MFGKFGTCFGKIYMSLGSLSMLVALGQTLKNNIAIWSHCLCCTFDIFYMASSGYLKMLFFTIRKIGLVDFNANLANDQRTKNVAKSLSYE